MESNVLMHRGARAVEREQLALAGTPPATASWYPLAHSQILQTVESTLQAAGFAIQKENLALSRGDARFFGTLDLTAAVAPGVCLSVGIRNSTDKSFPLGFCAGNRVMVCDNLSFHSELLVTRKHTKHGQLRFGEAIGTAVQSLRQFQEAESARIRRFQAADLSEDAANSYLLQAFEQRLISSPLLPRVIKEWREPTYDEFRPRTLFSLLNACTTALGDRQQREPTRYATDTMRLQHFLALKAGIEESAEPVPASAPESVDIEG